MKHIRTAIVEPQTLLRQLLRETLEVHPAFDVAGTSGDAGSLGPALIHGRPELVLLGINGPAAANPQILLLRLVAPEARIVVLLDDDARAEARALLQEGVAGIVLRDINREELIWVLRNVADGGMYVDPRVTDDILGREGDAPAPGLTPRERQIVELIAGGNSNKGIAATLSISAETVNSHVDRILRKLTARDRAEAVAVAFRRNLIS